MENREKREAGRGKKGEIEQLKKNGAGGKKCSKRKIKEIWRRQTS